MGKPKLTTKQQRFVDFYDGNATAAARKAGYKLPRQQGTENLAKPLIVKAIAEREKKRNSKTIATREQRQAAWTSIGYYDIRKLVDSDGRIKPIHELDDISARIVQGIKTTETYTSEGDLDRKIEYKLPDRLKALELLGRSEADFTDRIEGSLTLELDSELEDALKRASKS